MLEVTIREPTRTFYLHVGDRRVGKIVAKRNQRVQAFWTECHDNDDWCFVGWRDTLRQAAQSILERAKYGRSDGVVIERLKGIKS